MKIINLSYPIDEKTPLYGNNGSIELKKISDIKSGKTSNNTKVSMPLHAGTHIDFPNHFYESGQTLKDFETNFWFFDNPLVIRIKPRSYLIKDEIIVEIKDLDINNYDILIISTGSWLFRSSSRYINENYGIHPDMATIIREKLPNVRTMMLDTISISSYTDREIGREAHRRFLDPKKPILIIEDVNLEELNNNIVKRIIVSPLNIINVDGVPCSIYAEVE